jgi:hypothetical protein
VLGEGGGNANWTRGTLVALPFYFSAPTPLAKLAVVTANGVTGSAVRLGIYTDANGYPAALVEGSAAVDAGPPGPYKVAAFSPPTIGPGWYWFACVGQGTADPSLWTTPVGNIRGYTSDIPTADPWAVHGYSGYSQPGVLGALPSSWGSTYNRETRAPYIWFAAGGPAVQAADIEPDDEQTQGWYVSLDKPGP